MVLVKDNHVRALGGTDGLLAALSRHADNAPFVEVEVDSIDLLRAVITRRVDRIMLDNFTPEAVALALRVVRERDADPGRRIEIEVSGGITLENVRAYAQPGVDFISVGAITHSAPAAPVSLTVK